MSDAKHTPGPWEMDEELLAVAKSIVIPPPDDDGLVWLVLRGVGGKPDALFKLGPANDIAMSAVIDFEIARRAVLEKALGSNE